MPKGIIKYDLSDSDEEMSFLRAIKSLDVVLALWDIDQRLRSLEKYPEAGEENKFTREEFFDILDSHSIKLDDLIC